MRKEVGGVHTAPLSSIYLLLYLFQIKTFMFLLNSILVALSGAQQFSFMGKKNQSITQETLKEQKQSWNLFYEPTTSHTSWSANKTSLPPLYFCLLSGSTQKPDQGSTLGGTITGTITV